jgi:hypothetical protein
LPNHIRHKSYVVMNQNFFGRPWVNLSAEALTITNVAIGEKVCRRQLSQ